VSSAQAVENSQESLQAPYGGAHASLFLASARRSYMRVCRRGIWDTRRGDIAPSPSVTDENGVPWRKASHRSSEMGARRGLLSHRSELLIASSRTTATPWLLPVSPATSIAATCHLPPLSINKGAPLTPWVPAQLCRNNSRPLGSIKRPSIRHRVSAIRRSG